MAEKCGQTGAVGLPVLQALGQVIESACDI